MPEAGNKLKIPDDPYTDGLVIFIILLFLSGAVTSVLVKYRAPQQLLMIICGLASGLLCYYAGLVVPMWNPFFAFSVYTTLMTMKAAYSSIESFWFYKSLGQIITMLTFGNIMYVLALGLMIQMIWNEFPIVPHMLIFSSTIILPSDMPLVGADAEFAKNLEVMMSSDAVFSTATAFITFMIFFGHYQGFVTTWYHVLCLYVRHVLLGVLAGYALVLVSRPWFRRLLDDSANVICAYFALALFAHTFCEYVLYCSGTVACFITAFTLAQERVRMPAHVEHDLRVHVDAAYYFAQTTMLFVCSHFFVPMAVPKITLLAVVASFFICVGATLMRMLKFFIFRPLLNLMGVGFEWSNFMILLWWWHKGPLPLIFSSFLYHFDIMYAIGPTTAIYPLIYVFYHYFKVFAKSFHSSDLSLHRKTNISNTINGMNGLARRHLAVTKLNKYYTEANWSVIYTTTTLRNKFDEMSSDKQVVQCPECKAFTRLEPTPEDFNKYLREVYVKILRAERVSIVRQFDMGFINKLEFRLLVRIIGRALNSKSLQLSLSHLIRSIQKEKHMIPRKRVKACAAICPRVAKSCQIHYEAKSIHSVNMAKALITCFEDVLALLHTYNDNALIIEIARTNLLADRLTLIRELGYLGVKRPALMTTAKTAQAVDAVLHYMGRAGRELRTLSMINAIDLRQLQSKLDKQRSESVKYRIAAEILTPKQIFDETPWLHGDPYVRDFLYERAKTHIWNAGETICRAGESLEGVYVIIDGMLRMSYEPSDEYTKIYARNGELPVKECLHVMPFDEAHDDFFTCGNTVGELAVLTGRPYCCTLVCETPIHAFVLSTEVLESAFENNEDPVCGLKSRMWKCVVLGLAKKMLIGTPAHRTATMEEWSLHLGRAFVPNLDNYKLLVRNKFIEDMVLLEGIAVDSTTREIYSAPCYISRKITKLILPQTALTSFRTLKTKVLFLPAGTSDGYEIMFHLEKTSQTADEERASTVAVMTRKSYEFHYRKFTLQFQNETRSRKFSDKSEKSAKSSTKSAKSMKSLFPMDF